MERPETNLAKFGTAVREALAAEASTTDEIRQARDGFLHEFTARSGSTRGWISRATASHWRILLLAGATAAGVVAIGASTPRPVTFQVGAAGTTGRTGDLVQATAKGLLPLRFSEGSLVTLHEGGHLRVLATDKRGARVLIEDGTVDVSITTTRMGKKHWNFEAGPFQVLVTGTKFTLTYQALEQSFGLSTQEGQVVVSGACLNSPTPVAAGTRLDLSCLTPRTPHTASLEAVPPSGHESANPSATSGKPSRSTPTWRELLATGRLQEAVRAAERANFDRVCQTTSAKELLALADAARLFARTARAVTALRVLRQRFPSSAEASTAAFALGRIAFEQKHAFAEAVQWFATYLQEQPSGPLHGDCVGRLLEARVRAGDQTGARSDAEQYLRRFPEGPYASEARGILAK
jgi:transmembrane sensor